MAKKKATKPVKKKVAKKRATAASPVKATPVKATPVKAAKIRSVPVSPDQQLAAIDKELVGLLNQRVETFLKKVAQSESPQEAVFDVQDDVKLWTMLEGMNKGPLSTVELKSIFRGVLSAGRQRVKNIRVAYLGPAYSFTHLAAINRFGESADLVPVSTIATVFEEVNRGHVHYGLVPIENSTDGRCGGDFLSERENLLHVRCRIWKKQKYEKMKPIFENKNKNSRNVKSS